MTSEKTAAKLREDLGYPVIDNDGHILEIVPVLAEFVREVGGPDAVDRYTKAVAVSQRSTYGKQRVNTLQQRQDAWLGQTSFWGHTTNNYDRATSMVPRLLLERLEELGIDIAILYPTEGLYANRIEDDPELRQIVCRAINLYQHELFKGCESKLFPVAVIPTSTPDEAVAELEYAVKSLGYRTALLASGSRRNIPKYERELPDAAAVMRRMDYYGIDSAYDYDPLWKRLVDLGVPATFHGQTVGTLLGPSSVSNNTFNRVATVGNSYPALLTAMLLGGVVKRHPKLRFMFQEGGIGWMASLYCKMFGVWEKRGGSRIENYNPAKLDTSEIMQHVNRYGSDRQRTHLTWIEDLTKDLVTPEVLNDFADVEAETPEQFRDVFVDHFYAGCEADDFTTGFAFASLPGEAELRPSFGSDIGHWDVSNAEECLPEAYELVEHGILTDEQLRKFLFENAHQFYTSMNPKFFVGTALEGYSR